MWKFNMEVKPFSSPGSIQKKLQSLATEVCLYKSWTSEVHRIPKYLTNLEVHRAWNLRSRSDLSSTKKKLSSDHQFILRTWSWSFIQLKSTEVKHVSSAFSQSWSTTFESPKTEVKINAHHEVAPKKIFTEVQLTSLHEGQVPPPLEECIHLDLTTDRSCSKMMQEVACAGICRMVRRSASRCVGLD